MSIELLWNGKLTVQECRIIIPNIWNKITLPKGSQIIHIAYDYGLARIWYAFNSPESTEDREMMLLCTGYALVNVDEYTLTYHGTCVSSNGRHVWHLIERKM